MRTLTILIVLLFAAACGDSISRQDFGKWPPVLNKPYPDLTFLNHLGEPVKLSSFKGKLLLIEPLGMSCAACIAWNGGHAYGPFKGAKPQSDLQSLESYFPTWTNGLSLDDEDIVVIQIIFYNMEMQAPTVEDAKAWVEHFNIDEKKNHVVLLGPEAIREKSYDMIPGYQLVDRDFILRYDAAGHGPPHNLYSDLLSALGRMKRASAKPGR